MDKEEKKQLDQNKNKALRFFIFALVLILGVFIIIFGGYDDSPGAQGIGLLIILIGFWKIIAKDNTWKIKKKK